MSAEKHTPAGPTTAIRSAPRSSRSSTCSPSPGRQAQLVDILDRATDQVIRHPPGLVSANVHRSLDGTSVVNYAQWQSVEAFQAMLANPARSHMQEETSIAAATPALGEVVSVHHA